MRVFLFTRLFVLKGPQRELFVDMAGLTPFNKREFWELQVPKRSDQEDLLRCMRISRLDAKVISEILADTLSEEQKKLIEVESKTTGEDESSQKSFEERIEKRQDRQSIFDGFLNSVTNFKMPKIEKADQMLDDFMEKTEQQVRRSSQALKAKMSDAELFQKVNQKNGRSQEQEPRVHAMNPFDSVTSVKDVPKSNIESPEQDSKVDGDFEFEVESGMGDPSPVELIPTDDIKEELKESEISNDAPSDFKSIQTSQPLEKKPSLEKLIAKRISSPANKFGLDKKTIPSSKLTFVRSEKSLNVKKNLFKDPSKEDLKKEPLKIKVSVPETAD